jgi:hypothetical protein
LDANPLLLFLEGSHDIRFMRKLSATLHARDPNLPDLASCEQRGRIILIPIGGGDVCGWGERFRTLGLHEFYLCDREASHESRHRQAAIDLVNCRPNCRGFLTRKRAIENYLHPEAIRDACGVTVQFGDDDDVVECVGGALLGTSRCWKQLSRTARRHLRDRVKRCLNTHAVAAMTWERLAESDPEGEVVFWLETIHDLLQGTSTNNAAARSHRITE